MKSITNKARHEDCRSHWSIILAGGKGKEMRSLAVGKFDTSEPDQYCCLFGEQSLFQRTINRARQIMPEGNFVAVVLKEHAEIARRQISGENIKLLVQPNDRKTTAAIFLALSYIAAHDRKACVAVFPSDHYVHPEADFIKSIQRSIEISSLIPDKILLIGVCPQPPYRRYSWIIPGPNMGRYGPNRLTHVATIREHPGNDEIRLLSDLGGFWNTHIMVGNIEAFWDAGLEIRKQMTGNFMRFGSSIGSERESNELSALYEDLQTGDFEHDILRHVPHRLALFQIKRIHWSKWEWAEIIAESSRRIAVANLDFMQFTSKEMLANEHRK